MESIKLSSASGQLCCWIKNDSGKKYKKRDDAAEAIVSDGFRSRRRRESRKFLIEQAIPPILAIGLYSNSLGGDFVHDDLSAITSNPDVTGYHPEEGTSWDFLHNDFWGTSLLDPRSHKSYRPFTVLTFRWNYLWSGLNPWSYHAVNVLLHAFVCWLLHEWLCRRCFRLSRTTSLLTSSLFALHPVHTEAVSGIVGRADILATLFFLSSFICHDRATSHKSLQRPSSTYLLLVRAVSLLSALLALAAKENGIAALPVAIVWDVIRLTTAGNSTEDSSSIKSSAIINNNNIRFWKSKRKRLLRWRNSFYFQFKEHFYLFGPILLSVLMTLALLVGRISLQQGQMPVFSEQDNPAAFASNDISRILTLLYLPAFNMGLLLAPVLLSYDWQNGSIPLIESWTDVRNLGSIFLYASLILAVLYSWNHRQKAILWGIAVMVLPMLPASNLFYPCGFVVAERLLYLPSLGYCLIVAIGLGRIVEGILAGHHHRSTAAVVISCRRMSSTAPAVPQERPVVVPSPPKRFKILLLIGAILTASSFAAKTWTRNADWKDRKTLFRSGLESLPNNAKMHYNYANVQKDDGRWETAIHHYRQAIQLWPNYPSALNNLGTVLLAQAEEMDSKDDAGGNIFLRQDSELVREAEGRFREAILAHPHHIHAHYNLAIIHMQRNETDLAIRLLSRCIQLNPEHREAVRLLNRIQLPLDPETGIVAAGQENSVPSLLESRNVSREPQRTEPSAGMGGEQRGSSSQIDCSSSSRRWINMNGQDDRSSRERRREFLPGGCPNNSYRWNKTA